MVTIIMDFETSGLNAYHEDIIEIGAKICGEDIVFETFVQPKSNKAISKKITDITGISNKMLREQGKKYLNAYSDFYNWIIENSKDKESISIVSHNGDTFDFIFFKRILIDLKENGTDTSKLPKLYYNDTLPLCKRLYPGRTYYSQPSIARTFQILTINAHRAMNDVIVLEQIYTCILNDLSKHFDPNNPNMIRDYIDLII
jgi:DNA polymerase III alpha subunit (gram-positive type)